MLENTAGLALPVFRSVTAVWNAERRALEFAGRSYAVGDRMELTGGTPPRQVLEREPFSGLPAKCGSDRVFVVVG